MAEEQAGFEVALGGVRFDPLDDQALPQAEELLAPGEEAAPSAWIVQLEGPATSDDIARLREQHGLRLTDYVPNLAYVERLALGTVTALQGDPAVRAVAPYRPQYKLAPTLDQPPLDMVDEAEAEPGRRIRIVLFDDAAPDRVRSRLEDAAASEAVVIDDRPLGGAVRILASVPDRAAIDLVAMIDEVRWIEPVTPLVDDNVAAAATIQSGSAISTPIWDQDLHGEGQIIGVIDSSPLDINHCFFIDNNNNAPGGAHRKVVSIRNASRTPAGAHATFVAGCAAGDDVNNPGGAASRGGAWAARLASANRRDLDDNTLLAELNAAATAGAFIHTNSWHDDTAGAGNPATYNQNAADVDTFTWNNEDHLVLGSAGNTGEEQGPPGTSKNAVCVAAADADPNAMNLGDGNPGPTADGRRKPDLVTVGCGIRSAAVDTPCGTALRGCATSWATPHAAAAAALVRQYFTEGWYPTGRNEPSDALTPTGALLKAVLLASTIDMTGSAGYPSEDEGWGLVQLQRGLFFHGGGPCLVVFDVRNSEGLSTGQERIYTVEVEDFTEPLKVVLVWTEPPGTAGATNPVVNNLDLEVTDPAGSITFRGNVFSGQQSTTGGTADATNNVEMVLVNSPTVGTWQVKVSATQVSVGTQGYANVALGKFQPALPEPVTLAEQGSDLALVRQTPGWHTIPIAFSKGDGTWTITNGEAPNFIGQDSWSSGPGVRVVAGDFV